MTAQQDDRTPVSREAAQEPQSSAEYHQQRGVAWDIVDEALIAYREFMLDDDYDAMTALKKICDRMEERRALYAPAPTAQEEGWREIGSAPKDGTPFLAWCPIVVGLGDSDATPDAEIRVLWWEARGQFTSDRDLGDEAFTHWMPLPEPPRC